MRSKMLKGHKKREGSRENYIAGAAKRKQNGYKFKHSEESKAKMSVAHKGKKKTPEHIANIKIGQALARERNKANKFTL